MWVPMRWAACALLVAAWAAPAAAQPLFDSWTVDDGLPQDSVNDIVQTRDGYLWLATYGGLVRFDGVRFTIFDRSVEGIGSQRVRRLLEDRSGTLWAATEDGKLIRYRGGSFTTFGREHGLPRSNAVRIEEDGGGHLWITWLNVLSRFDGQRAVNYQPSDFGDISPPVGRYQDLWSSIDDAGLHVLRAGEIHTIQLDPDVRRQFDGAFFDDTGHLWVRTRDRTMLLHDRGRITRYDAAGFPEFLQSGFFADSRGRAWYHTNDALFEITNGGLRPMGRVGMLSVMEDREGSLWLGTISGLHRLRNFTFTTYSMTDGLSWDASYSAVQDAEGAIWIGNRNRGIDRFEGGRFRNFSEADGLPSRLISALHADPDGRVWIGTSDGGLSYVERGRIRRSPLVAADAPVTAILRGRDGTLWLGSGPSLLRATGGRVERYTSEDGLPYETITALLESRSGGLWVGGAGVSLFTEDRFLQYGEHEGLTGTVVRALHEDADGVLWIGTYDAGLFRLAGDRVTRFTRTTGLFDNGVFQILEDAEGFLWMGSNRGISRVSRRELNAVADGRQPSVSPMVFGTRDGLARAEVNGGWPPSGLKSADGRLWFPTMGGVAVVDPASVALNTNAPTTVLEAVSVDGVPMDTGRTVRMPWHAGALEIRYTAPSFISPERVRFRYRLEGLDPAWVEAGEARRAVYHRLPPGSYRFMVIAANHHGIWGDTGPVVDVVVLPPFWRTWWFTAVSAVAILALGVTAHRRRVRKLERQNHEQRAFAQQLIGSQEAERRRISSEMHDSLGQHVAILSRRARTSLESVADVDVRATLEEIIGTARQIDAEVKDIAYGLRPYQLDRLGLTRTIRTMAERVGEKSGIECSVRIEPIDEAVPQAGHIHVYRIVQECLSNIVKHSNARRASVDATIDDGFVTIRVEDDGTGIDGKQDGQAGLGLMSIRERARILGGRVEIRPGTECGTVITARLPRAGTTGE